MSEDQLANPSSAGSWEEQGIPDGSVVVGVDGSPRDAIVVEWAAKAALRRSAGLHVIYAQEAFASAYAPVGFGLDAPLVTQTGEEVDESGAVFSEVERVLGAMSERPASTFSVPWGTASQALLAAEEAAQLIVVGSARKAGLERFLLGSTSHTVAMYAKCPVVVIGPEGFPDFRGQLVVGVDGSRDSSRALRFAMNAAAKWGVRVTALTTWNMAVIDGYVVTEPDSQEWRRTVDDLHQAVATVIEKVRAEDDAFAELDVQVQVQHGRPITALVEASKEADLVVVGSRGRGGVAGSLLGSVSQGVLAGAKCPVAVLTYRT